MRRSADIQNMNPHYYGPYNINDNTNAYTGLRNLATTRKNNDFLLLGQLAIFLCIISVLG